MTCAIPEMGGRRDGHRERGPYDAWGISVDGTLPLAGDELRLPIGVSTQVSTQSPYGNYPGYTSTVTSSARRPSGSRMTGYRTWLVRLAGNAAHNDTAAVLHDRRFPAAGDLPRLPGPELGTRSQLIGEPGRPHCRATEPEVVAHRRSLPLQRGQPTSFSDLYTAIQPNGYPTIWSWDFQIKGLLPFPAKRA